jgi:hypothetical protein
LNKAKLEEKEKREKKKKNLISLMQDKCNKHEGATRLSFLKIEIFIHNYITPLALNLRNFATGN